MPPRPWQGPGSFPARRCHFEGDLHGIFTKDPENHPSADDDE
jgi:hypothetical protein